MSLFTRCLILGALMLSASTSPMTAAVPQSGAAGPKVKATHVGGSVHMVDAAEGVDEFVGGNVAVSVGPDGMFVVDTMVTAFAPELRALLGRLSDRPIRFVVNSHVHFDHTGGNAVFGAMAPIIAHRTTYDRMSGAIRAKLATENAQTPRPGALPEARPLPAGLYPALPVISIDDRITLHMNGETIDVVHFPRSHSDTDVVVFFRDSNVVHMGDLYFAGIFPYIADGGSMGGLIRTIETVVEQVPPDAKIIPGHGPLSNVKELRETLAMLKETRSIVEEGIRQNRTLEEMKKAKVLRKFDRWAEPEYFGTDQYLEQIYKVLRSAG